MEPDALIAYIPNSDPQTIRTALQFMQMTKDTQEQDAGTVTNLQTGTMFVA